MATAPDQYDPDYAVPPGWVLKERLDAQGMTPAELARRCGGSVMRPRRDSTCTGSLVTMPRAFASAGLTST